MAAGADMTEVHRKMIAKVLGYDVGKEPDISREEYLKYREPAFGKTNPELADNPFWRAMVRCGGGEREVTSKFNQDSFEPGSIWSYDREGMSTTLLPDGRFIQIGGEHDTCDKSTRGLYNDVIIHDGKGNFDIYIYPEEIFPPISYHTATLVANHIYIIGVTHLSIFRLDITTMNMEKIETSGHNISYIGEHNASYDGESTITIRKDGYRYTLCLKSMQWEKINIARIRGKLLDLIYRSDDDQLMSRVEKLIDEGSDLNLTSKCGLSPLRKASCNGRFDVVRLLLSRGADADQLVWTDIFHTIAYGDSEDLKKDIASGCDLEHRDYWGRTPFLFSIAAGDTDKTAMLIEAGADTRVIDNNKTPPLFYDIERDNVDMLNFMLDRGFDIEQRYGTGNTPLIVAAQSGAVKCLKALVDRGADIFAENPVDEYLTYTAIGEASDWDMISTEMIPRHIECVKILLAAGVSITEVHRKTIAKMLGYDVGKEPDISREEYLKYKTPAFGKTNPELADNPFWRAMVRCGGEGSDATKKFNGNHFKDGPVWTYDRYGMSTTLLPDGRIVQIAGQHEMGGDPHFCIYNDVIVHDGKGDFDIYIYPKEVFPLTDFHTATLVANHIYIIGNCDPDDIREGYMPIFRLDITTMKMEKIKSSGDTPGYGIYKHKTDYDGVSTITVSGGERYVDVRDGVIQAVGNPHKYALCLESMHWTRLD